MPDWKLSVGRVRWLGMVEALSFLALVAIAMPLKYLAGLPEAVKWTGWVHGLLFIVYCFSILLALINGRLSFVRSCLAFVASLVPFGPFLIDRKLAGDEAREAGDREPS